MKVTKSEFSRGIIGISGHAGAGHVHSHSGFVQDDTAGFAVAICLLRRAFPASTIISSVEGDIDTGFVTVRTQGGGIGVAKARRGITPHEASLVRRAVGKDGVYSQNAAFAAFGRIYGQGVFETPVALQTAICLAVINTFEEKYPGLFVVGHEDMPGKVGKCIGAVLDIDGIAVSVLALLNASDGGIGPDEDLEGNIMLGDKGRAMKELGLDKLPTIILESKAYVPAFCKGCEKDSLWVRMNEKADNRSVFRALVRGAESAGVPCISSDTVYLRGTEEMAEATRSLGRRIAALGEELAAANLSRDKVRIVAELAVLVSQDAGGITFMSGDLHSVVGGGGLMPGSAAVLSMTVSEHQQRIWKIPAFNAQDADAYLAVLQHALPFLASDIESAKKDIAERSAFCEQKFAHLLQEN